MKYNTIEITKLFDCNGQDLIGYNHNYGTIDELKGLINACHNNNIKVIVDVNHYSVPKDEILPSAYFNHSDDNNYYYDYSKVEVIKMLLCQLRYLMTEYCVDGFMFNNVTEIMYIYIYIIIIIFMIVIVILILQSYFMLVVILQNQ